MTKTATAKSKKRARTKTPSKGGGIDVDAAHRNISILKRRRVRIQKCVANLQASVDGKSEIDADDIVEAINLLGLYKRRLGKAKARHEAKLSDADNDTVEED